MKHIPMSAIVAAVAGCASLHTIRDEAEAIGLFRLSGIDGTHDIALRPNHTCVLSSYTASNRAPLVEGTWTFNGGVVTVSPSNSRPIVFDLARRGLEVV